MHGNPDLASVAALIGDPSRAAILTALADGRALPAGELAATAGLSPSGASAQLARLLQGGLLAVEREGRHRYYRLARPQVAAALESLAPLATGPRQTRARSTGAIALRRARTCYDHIAGELGVALRQEFERRGLLLAADESKELKVTPAGERWFAEALDIEIAQLRPGRHGVAYRCLDWTERRHHIAGPLGKRLLRHFKDQGWIRPAGENPRAIKLSPPGAAWMRNELNVVFPLHS